MNEDMEIAIEKAADAICASWGTCNCEGLCRAGRSARAAILGFMRSLPDDWTPSRIVQELEQ